jgi:hypothetical protein
LGYGNAPEAEEDSGHERRNVQGNAH